MSTRRHNRKPLRSTSGAFRLHPITGERRCSQKHPHFQSARWRAEIAGYPGDDLCGPCGLAALALWDELAGHVEPAVEAVAA